MGLCVHTSRVVPCLPGKLCMARRTIIFHPTRLPRVPRFAACTVCGMHRSLWCAILFMTACDVLFRESANDCAGSLSLLRRFLAADISWAVQKCPGRCDELTTRALPVRTSLSTFGLLTSPSSNSSSHIFFLFRFFPFARGVAPRGKYTASAWNS
jgi:hypothetical protein